MPVRSFVLSGSSSIGRAVVRAFVDAGHDVAATFRTHIPPGLEAAAWLRADVRSTADLDALTSAARHADVLVLLPGLSLGQQLADYTDAQTDEVIDVNFTGQFRAVQRLAPVLAPASQIVIMGSMAGQRGSGDPLYGATKGAMHALAKSLAKSLAPRTRVNVLAPGMVTGTAMVDGTPQAVLEAHLNATPTGHFVSAQDLAQIVLDLTKPHWRQLNGACIDVNGGQYVR